MENKEMIHNHAQSLAKWEEEYRERAIRNFSLAMEAELPVTNDWEQFELEGDNAKRLRFKVHRVALNASAIRNIEFEI